MYRTTSLDRTSPEPPRCDEKKKKKQKEEEVKKKKKKKKKKKNKKKKKKKKKDLKPSILTHMHDYILKSQILSFHESNLEKSNPTLKSQIQP
ncbi:hypothetical protein DUI87_15083 [Hirundo rustica rustica]|uniref:Uncharacterized protein n=1 Tax=Hirundo rustica rustica TaxID=333673 RepID=A0A3M0K6N9_HIRRU|nr:hypothetical protein DUI87_15083 [Hirundo rustica rustica]